MQGLFKEMLAEWALASMLWFAKDMQQVVRNQQGHKWAPFVSQPLRCACS